MGEVREVGKEVGVGVGVVCVGARVCVCVCVCARSTLYDDKICPA